MKMILYELRCLVIDGDDVLCSTVVEACGDEGEGRNSTRRAVDVATFPANTLREFKAAQTQVRGAGAE